ncbi:MAB_1171c family putative transporter [Streptomyces sp. NPDC093568]|uniref:MAB_1171c family putative transporter n=1 Tax=Streptomyces sp. NPDC093568 TaxID=3366041 RepID=UPI00382256D0
MSALLGYVSCAVLWLGVAVKVPDLVRHRRDPYLRAICAVLGLGGLCFFLGAPPTVGAVNRLSGVPNLAAPLTYAAITACGAASQILVTLWRGGPGVHRTARRWVLAYAGVVLCVAALFLLGDAPVERREDLDTYYATTPYLREMILLYLAGHLTAVTVTAVSALRWAREVRGPLRAGMLTLGAGAVCGAGYSVSKLIAVAARWTGRDWPTLGTDVAQSAAGLSAVLTATGVLIPLAGPRLAEWRRARRTYTRLAPLERELDDVLTRRRLRLPRPRWSSPATRLVWRQTSIHNALSHLDAYVDRELYDETHEAALRATGDPERAAATAWAAVIATAARTCLAEQSGCPWDGPAGAAREAWRAVPAAGHAGESEWFQERAPGPEALVRIADALVTSPLARGALAGARAAERSSAV